MAEQRKTPEELAAMSAAELVAYAEERDQAERQALISERDEARWERDEANYAYGELKNSESVLLRTTTQERDAALARAEAAEKRVEQVSAEARVAWDARNFFEAAENELRAKLERAAAVFDEALTYTADGNAKRLLRQRWNAALRDDKDKVDARNEALDFYASLPKPNTPVFASAEVEPAPEKCAACKGSGRVCDWCGKGSGTCCCDDNSPWQPCLPCSGTGQAKNRAEQGQSAAERGVDRPPSEVTPVSARPHDPNHSASGTFSPLAPDFKPTHLSGVSARPVEVLGAGVPVCLPCGREKGFEECDNDCKLVEELRRQLAEAQATVRAQEDAIATRRRWLKETEHERDELRIKIAEAKGKEEWDRRALVIVQDQLAEAQRRNDRLEAVAKAARWFARKPMPPDAINGMVLSPLLGGACVGDARVLRRVIADLDRIDSGTPLCGCGHAATEHVVDDEERRGCAACDCYQFAALDAPGEATECE